MSYYATSSRKSNAKLAVVETEQEAEPDEPVHGDGDGGEDNEYDLVSIRLTCIECATSCLSSNPELGDPVDMARRLYKFVLEG